MIIINKNCVYCYCKNKGDDKLEKCLCLSCFWWMLNESVCEYDDYCDTFKNCEECTQPKTECADRTVYVQPM